jgi:hypothetical protein
LLAWFLYNISAHSRIAFSKPNFCGSLEKARELLEVLNAGTDCSLVREMRMSPDLSKKSRLAPGE